MQEVRRSIEAISHRPVFIFCEGETDVAILNSLLNYVGSHYHLALDNVHFISKNGKEHLFEIPSLVQLVTNSVSGPGAVLVVIDEDARSMEQFLLNTQQDIPDSWEYQVAMAKPTLEAWAGLQQTSLHEASRLAQLQTALWNVNWKLQASQIQELENVLDFLKRVLPCQ